MLWAALRSIATIVSVCLSARISQNPHVETSRSFLCMFYDRGSVLLWRERKHNHTSGTADRLRRCQLSSPVSVMNFWRSAAMLITSTVEICIQQLDRVEEMVFTARRNYASAVLGVVILSVCSLVRLSVCHTRAL